MSIGIPAREDVFRLAGVADPPPQALRAGAAALAALAMAGLTVAGSDPDALGAGFGKLFLVFAIVVGPAVAALLVLRPWTGAVAWAAMLPLLDVPRLQVWAGSVQVTQTTIFVAALAAGVAFDRTSSGRDAVAPWPRAATLTAVALIGLSALSLLAAPAPADGVPIVLHGIAEPILVALLVLAARPSPRALAALGGALVVGVALASVYSIIRTGRVATSLDELEAMRVSLAHFTYYNVGIFGDALAMSFPFAITGLIGRRTLGLSRLATLALLAIVAALLVALWLTFSKSAWLGAWVGAAIVVVARFRRPRELAALALAGAVALALIVPYPQYLRSALGIDIGGATFISVLTGPRASSWDVGSTEGEVSIAERVRATIAAGKMARDHPLLGVGPGRFGAEYQTTAYADASATRHLGSPHDFLPEVAAELGLPALFLVIGALAAAAWWAFRAIRAPDPLVRLVGGAYLAGLVAFLAVATTFGLDFYRAYRVMNADVVMAGLIVGGCGALAAGVRSRSRAARGG